MSEPTSQPSAPAPLHLDSFLPFAPMPRQAMVRDIEMDKHVFGRKKRQIEKSVPDFQYQSYLQTTRPYNINENQSVH
jgi:hypothetical protein